MSLGAVVLRAVEAAIALAIVALLVCFVKFGWMDDITERVTTRWVDTTDPMFDADWLDYIVPKNQVPDRIDPIVGPYPDPPSPGPSPEPKL